MDRQSRPIGLEEAKGRWVEELPQVLWLYHTTPHSTTQETPFQLTFDIKAVILNKEEIQANLDLLQEVREIVDIKEYATKVRATRRYGRRVSSQKFKNQDHILRKLCRNTNANKCIPNWEGPFKIMDEVGKGAYKLKQLDGQKIPHTWNTTSLHFYYS
ncbi:hypothetical protein CR513_21144, partial [Mucuna pruriens]